MKYDISTIFVISAIVAIVIVSTAAPTVLTLPDNKQVASAVPSSTPPGQTKGGTAPGQSRCTSDGDCPFDYVCISGYCTKPCTSDSECRTGEVCDNGACVAAPPGQVGATPGNIKCSSNANCPSGQVCIHGNCGPCTSSEQCDEGQFCDEPIGVCVFPG